jgi:hypothetical protein
MMSAQTDQARRKRANVQVLNTAKIVSHLMNKYDKSAMPRAGGNLKKAILMECGGS